VIGADPLVSPVRKDGTMEIKECALCGSPAAFLCVQRILQKYDADYFQCPWCDLIQTESLYWLAEAPWSSIAQLDTGAITRHAACVRVTVALAHIFDLDPASRCLHYRAGSGLFVRAMRDHGSTSADGIFTPSQLI
jgi:hypothetical protein